MSRLGAVEWLIVLVLAFDTVIVLLMRWDQRKRNTIRPLPPDHPMRRDTPHAQPQRKEQP